MFPRRWLLSSVAAIVATGLLHATEPNITSGPAPKGFVDGRQVVLVYFTGSKCAPCNLPEMKKAVLEAKRLIGERARQMGVEYSTIGVAIDADPAVGFKFLQDVGPFDQVAAGGEFGNVLVLETMMKTPSPLLAIPNILVFEQSIEMGERKLRASERKYLATVPGTGIPLWVKYGAQLEGDAPAAPKAQSGE